MQFPPLRHFISRFHHSIGTYSRSLLMALAAGCLLGGSSNWAQTDWLNLGLDSQQERYTIKFNNVSAIEFMNFVTRISGKNFIYDASQVNFNITIASEEPASSEEVLSMLIQIVRMNGFTVNEEGSNILLYQAAVPISNLSRITTDAEPGATGLVTRVYRLRYAKPQNVVDIISKLATDPARVAMHQATKQIIVCDTVGNAERIATLIQTIDQIDSTMEIEIYKVKHSNLAALKSFADQIMAPFGKGGASTGGASSGASAGGASSGVAGPSAAGSLTIIPNMNSNTLFLIGSRELIDRAIGVLGALDVPSELEALAKSHEKRTQQTALSMDPSRILDPQINPEFYIYKLQYHPGDQILATLTSIGGALNASGGSKSLDPPLLNAMQTLQWLPATNSIIFSGDDATIIKLRNLIQGLDTPVRQVFIEALILDTSISNANTFGVELANDFTWGSAKTGATISNMRPKNGSSIQSDVGTNFTNQTNLPPTPNPGNFTAGVIGSLVSHKGHVYGTIGALITAVQTDSDTRIVLNPKILTEDNSPCEFFVGQEVRIKSGLVQNSGNNNVTSSNFEIFDVGTRLKLTPTISTEDLITLDVQQETSSALDTSSASDSSALVPLTQTSRTTTRLHVPDRHFVILGGMIDDTLTKTNSRIPLLGSIPVLGVLFRSETKSSTRRNLLFFIRPHIVTTNEEANMLTSRYKDIVDQRKFIPKDIEKQLEFLRPAEFDQPAPKKAA